MPTKGNQLSLLRLETRWSVEECSYRLMLQTNEVHTPEDWLVWERSSDDSQAGRELEERLDDIAAVFGIDREYFHQTKEPSETKTKVLNFPVKSQGNISQPKPED